MNFSVPFDRSEDKRQRVPSMEVPMRRAGPGVTRGSIADHAGFDRPCMKAISDLASRNTGDRHAVIGKFPRSGRSEVTPTRGCYPLGAMTFPSRIPSIVIQ